MPFSKLSQLSKPCLPKYQNFEESRKMFLKIHSTERVVFMEYNSAGKLWKNPSNCQRVMIKGQSTADYITLYGKNFVTANPI